MTDWGKLTVKQRLRVLRKALGLTQAGFAAEIGADPGTDAYGAAERTGNISQMAPLIYRRWPQIDAGWLFQGLTGNVPSAFEKRLDETAERLGIVPGKPNSRPGRSKV